MDEKEPGGAESPTMSLSLQHQHNLVMDKEGGTQLVDEEETGGAQSPTISPSLQHQENLLVDEVMSLPLQHQAISPPLQHG